MIWTVSGPIEPDELGRTTMHEHLLIDVAAQYAEPAEPIPPDLKVSMENLGTIRWNVNAVPDNLVIDDVDLVVEELADMHALGASGVVDLTIEGLGPRIPELVEIASRTGLNVMVGCGFYVHVSHPDWLDDASADDIAAYITGQLRDGIGDTDVRPALVGEIGTSHPVTERERKVVAGAARAAAAASASINIHLEPRGRNALSILETIEAEGVPADRVIFSHLDEALDMPYHHEIAAAGAILEYDAFGQEWYYSPDRYKDPSDEERCEAVAELVGAGYAEQLVLACDVCMKSCLKAYGGVGVDHLFRRIVPLLEERWDIGQDVLDTMLVQNPRRLLDRPAL
jgi:phosphotriesterase-related protein